MAKSKIIEGLKEAVRIARCNNWHADSHVCHEMASRGVSGEISNRRYACKCIKCDRTWHEERTYDGLEITRIISKERVS